MTGIFVLVPLVAGLCVYMFALPKIVQTVLSTSQLKITNNTIMPCTRTSQLALDNTGFLRVNSPVATTVHEYTTDLSAWVCPDNTPAYTCAEDSRTKVILGSFVAPEMEAKGGWNDLSQHVVMQLHDDQTLWVLMTAVLSATLTVPSHPILMTIESSDVSVSVLGRKLTGLTMKFDLTCTFVSQPIPGYGDDEQCPGDSEDDREPVNGLAQTLSCTQGFNELTSSDDYMLNSAIEMLM